MKKLSPIVFAFLLGGCSHYVTLHKQEPILEKYERLPARFGLFVPDEIKNDSIDLHDALHILEVKIKTGPAYSEALISGLCAATQEIVLLDSFPTTKVMTEKSLRFALVPTRINTHLRGWPGSILHHIGIAAFQCNFELNILSSSCSQFDSIPIFATGVCDAGQIDSIEKNSLGCSGDSAIREMQYHLIYGLKNNSRLRDSLSLIRLGGTDSLLNRTFYGRDPGLILDLTTHKLYPLPVETQLSFYLEFGGNGGNSSLNIDLLYLYHLSLRFGFGFLPRQTFSIFSGAAAYPEESLVLMSSYLFFNSEHHLELGGGVLADFGYKFSGMIANPNQQKIQPTGVLGYRYQSYLGGFVLRAGYTPYLVKNGYKNYFGIGYGLVF